VKQHAIIVMNGQLVQKLLDTQTHTSDGLFYLNDWVSNTLT